jgi:transaldolase/glucose-6-phosphate isomerase
MSNASRNESGKAANPVRDLQQYGQSPWLDYIQRSLIQSGELARMVRDDGIKGVTSNPAIFEKAVAGSDDYRDLLEQGAVQGLRAEALYERIAIRDIQDAAQVLQPVYTTSARRDGYVSLEVAPRLAHDTDGTIAEARRLWAAVGQPNVMIKVPATPAGIPAIRTLVADRINVNVTLIFSREAYRQVALAYIEGLTALVARGGDPSVVASVASFFVSRIDSAVDAAIESSRAKTRDERAATLLGNLLGKAAIANAKLAYAKYAELFSGAQWQELAAKGAQTQRVLWASTGTKNPAYRDVLYVEELIGRDTVNTIPPATLDAFRDHGQLRPSLTEDLESARRIMAALEDAGISMTAITERLLAEGVTLFADAFDKLLDAVARHCSSDVDADRQTCKLPPALNTAVERSLADWDTGGKVGRMWARDASLWSGTDEAQWLGWLTLPEEQRAELGRLQAIARAARSSGLKQVLLLGMGGSSMCPEVLQMTFGRTGDGLELHVLDSTDPGQVAAFENKVDLKSTLFIVASKSGSTLEPNIFMQYFRARVGAVLGAKLAPSRFIAITDPGSKLDGFAKAQGFREVVYGVASVGGRYSALSAFGLLPAVLLGLDAGRLLDRARAMAKACAADVPATRNPGVILGTLLGVAAASGRDKLTVIAAPAIISLGAWLEQLLAESTGKNGLGILPVDREAVAEPKVYGADRVFVYLTLDGNTDKGQDAAIDTLEGAGHPVVRIALSDRYDLGREFFRWEIATAVAGAILGINPFDQPDVEAAKIETRKLTEEYERVGQLPAETPLFAADGVGLFTDSVNASTLRGAAPQDLAGYLRAHLARAQAGDYIALLAYIEMNEQYAAALQEIRHLLRDRLRVATCLGFGPRFLHSTGQAYKGGPNSALVLQITCEDALSLPVPGQRYTFGVVKAAQARGDFQVLAARGRRALRVHLGADLTQGLATLRAAVAAALA